VGAERRRDARDRPGDAGQLRRGQLDLAGLVEVVHDAEGVGHGGAHAEQAVVAQDQRHVVAQRGLDAAAFLQVEGHAFVGMDAHRLVELGRDLVELQQALLAGGHGHTGHGVGVDDAVRVVARGVHRAVDGEAGRVHRGAALHHLAVQVDHDQVAGAHLLEQQAEGVEQETLLPFLATGQPGREVGVERVVPAEAGGQAVGGGQVAAQDGLVGLGGVGHEVSVKVRPQRQGRCPGP
jgi:hypothetical protein